MTRFTAFVNKGTHHTGAMARPSLKLSTNEHSSLRQNDIVITQPRRYFWSTGVDFVWLKGFTQRKHSASVQRPVIPATTKLVNAQFDIITTVIPRLIVDKVLGHRLADGSIEIFKDIEDFIRCESHSFVVLNHNVPFFRTTKQGPSRKDPSDRMTNEALTVRSLCSSFTELCASAGLPNGRPYNCRHNGGDVARITMGREGQATVLHHGALSDRGRMSYSHGIGDTGIARLLLQEFRPGDEDAHSRLQSSEYYSRQKDGPAVHEMIRRNNGGSVAVAIAPAQQAPKISVTKAELDELCLADGEAVRLHGLWLSAKAQESRDEQQVRYLHDAYQKRRVALRGKRYRELKRERLKTAANTPPGPFGDYDDAYEELVARMDRPAWERHSAEPLLIGKRGRE